jgi:hypothetical protein
LTTWIVVEKPCVLLKKKDQPCVLLEEKPHQTEKNERPGSNLKKPCVLLKNQIGPKKTQQKPCVLL